MLEIVESQQDLFYLCVFLLKESGQSTVTKECKKGQILKFSNYAQIILKAK